MTNFAFLPNRFSEIAVAATKAEGHIHGDPRAACFRACLTGLGCPGGFGNRRLICC